MTNNDMSFTSPANSQAPMVLTTLNYLDAKPVRFVQFPAVDGQPTKRDPKAWLVVDDEVLDSFGFKEPFRELIHGLIALELTTDPDAKAEDAPKGPHLHQEIQILGEEKDIIPFVLLSYVEERAAGDPKLEAFVDWCFTQTWDVLTGQCVCRTFTEFTSDGDRPRSKLKRTSASDGVETLEDAIQRIEEMARDKACLVESIEEAYRAIATVHRKLKATQAAHKSANTRRKRKRHLVAA